MSPESTNEIVEAPKAKGFKEEGFSFIPIREAHLGFVAWMMDRTAPDFRSIFGAAMVDKNYIPVGMLLAYFEPDGTVSIHAHFGKYLRRYPKDVLRHMKGFMNTLREQGHSTVYAIADESVEGSHTLIKWFKGELTGKRAEFGPIYRIDLTRTPI